MNTMRGLLIAMLAAGCASRGVTSLSTVSMGHQLVIRERITFMGAEGQAITPEPGTYRVTALGPDRLRLESDSATRIVAARKERLTTSAVVSPTALITMKGASTVRQLWLFLPDATVREARGGLTGVRTRGPTSAAVYSPFDQALAILAALVESCAVVHALADAFKEQGQIVARLERELAARKAREPASPEEAAQQTKIIAAIHEDLAQARDTRERLRVKLLQALDAVAQREQQLDAALRDAETSVIESLAATAEGATRAARAAAAEALRGRGGLTR